MSGTTSESDMMSQLKSTNPSRHPQSGMASKVVLLVLVQVVVIFVLVGATMARRHEQALRKELPPMRRVPLTIAPLYDRPDVVSDEQLLDVLHKLRPRFRGPGPKINHVDHALRFWGVESNFRDPECLSGEEMRDILLNHAHFREVWGDQEPPLLECSEDCVGVRTQEGDATASHVDHTIASLAEVGTPLDFPIHTPEGPRTMADLLAASLNTFEINQVEYEWSALAYTLYCERLAPFADKYGQEMSFDRLADRLIRERCKLGVCLGNHRLHTLAVMLRADEQQSILSPECRKRVVAHLMKVTGVLVASQDPEGYWNQYWATGEPPRAGDDNEQSQLDPLGRKMVATGHALEWWALAPEEILPPRDVVQRAGQWLAKNVMALQDDEIVDKYTFLSHVGRALALWRGHEPLDFIEAMQARAGTL